ncbi:akap7 [Pungitius sinensis]
MGQLCCFPFSQAEEKINLNLLQARRLSGRRRSEPDEAELLRVSRRLVEDAVNRALLQYKQESLQNGGGPNATPPQPPGDAEELATKTDAAVSRK